MAHPMDVLRTGVSVLGCVRPEAEDHNAAGAREIADALLASLPSMLLYWHHFARNGKRIESDADSESARRAFSSSAARQPAQHGVGPRHAGFAHPLCGA